MQLSPPLCSQSLFHPLFLCNRFGSLKHLFLALVKRWLWRQNVIWDNYRNRWVCTEPSYVKSIGIWMDHGNESKRTFVVQYSGSPEIPVPFLLLSKFTRYSLSPPPFTQKALFDQKFGHQFRYHSQLAPDVTNDFVAGQFSNSKQHWTWTMCLSDSCSTGERTNHSSIHPSIVSLPPVC